MYDVLETLIQSNIYRDNKRKEGKTKVIDQKFRTIQYQAYNNKML